MKYAIIQCADSGPLESLVEMLEAVGYECLIPSDRLKMELRNVFGGKGLVLDIANLVRSMGYEKPSPTKEASVGMMDRSDVIYVDVKAHQIYENVVTRWPTLKGKVLWYRINGGKPEHVVNARGDHGDEVNPSCPVLTPNQWYKKPWIDDSDPSQAMAEVMDETPWNNCYCCWPPFVRFDEYKEPHMNGVPRKRGQYKDSNGNWVYSSPICLIHGFKGWGYSELLPAMERLGVSIYGQGSPMGLINHAVIPAMLTASLAMVHLKSSDAPGYALYEAMAAGCPIICTRKLIWKCRMQELLIPGQTCLVFDRETHDGFTAEDLVECEREVKEHLVRLRDPSENQRIGIGGYNRLKEVMWSSGKIDDCLSLSAFMGRHFGS